MTDAQGEKAKKRREPMKSALRMMTRMRQCLTRLEEKVVVRQTWWESLAWVANQMEFEVQKFSGRPQ
jgi:hypothetical protein